jgi:uncharacterized protein YbbC (DUF1343 family)
MKTGIDRLLADAELLSQLKGRRVALVAHPASVTADLTHSLDALLSAGVPINSAFGTPMIQSPPVTMAETMAT